MIRLELVDPEWLNGSMDLYGNKILSSTIHLFAFVTFRRDFIKLTANI